MVEPRGVAVSQQEQSTLWVLQCGNFVAQLFSLRSIKKTFFRNEGFVADGRTEDDRAVGPTRELKIGGCRATSENFTFVVGHDEVNGAEQRLELVERVHQSIRVGDPLLVVPKFQPVFLP